MPYAYTVFTQSIASNTTLGSMIDLGGAWEKVFLDVPVKASGSVCIQAAAQSTGTFKRVAVDNLNTLTAHADFTINSSITSRMVPVPINGLRYIKIELTTLISDATSTWNVICGNM
jgi:hypothetical protein